MNRDELIEAGHRLIAPRSVGSMSRTEMNRLLDLWDPLIRTDERERILDELVGPARESEAMYAHAEAVAARLVEVIVQDAEALRNVHAAWRKTNRGYIEVENERDAARAERLEALRKVAALDDQLAAARAEVAAHGLEVAQAHADAHREVLADVRAKVEGLRDEAIWARRGTIAENGLDTVPSAWHNGRTSLADAVLALLDEADNA